MSEFTFRMGASRQGNREGFVFLDHLKLVVVLFLAGASLVSCSSYPKDFDLEVEKFLAEPPDDFEGPWVGHWTSVPTGHTGPLWCLIRPTNGAENRYQFHYRAGWGPWLRGEFDHEVDVVRRGGKIGITERMDLGRLGGVYTLESVISGADWGGAHHSNKGDHGRVVMKRPSREQPR